ncbi:nitrate ABC transporter substrate-binding protein [Psychrobacter sp. YP14]|jgi:ABC-type nitrate/sulfonate/bicarbonate transport system substrate-binding protein|uniref:Nitrate ABC transporter substrate-binding protein n=3 Tax=Psychrobacter TaxID=497 RepID=A0A844M2U0_9GAMM|nr:MULTISPECIES: ABC transporter substrate-binding protein [Psychrobacter]AWT49233.1 nitrate ABC transporter substrate-binding protein [Psychrobacter sp. YP14]MUG32837.1 nitrate ABC transporter substrate-binding protein [Psychrobacter sanguinis]
MLMAIMALSLMACQPKETSTKAASDTTDALTQVVISLDWVPNTNHTGLYVAQDKGYFKEQGLEVQIVQPSEDSASTLVANDRADFGIYFQPNMVSRLEKGVPITAVAAILQHNPAGLLSLKSLGAKSPKDLNGKRYSTWEDPIDDATVSHIVGNDLVKIPGEATDATVALRMNQFDYILAYYGWDGVHAKLKGVDTNFFFLRDYEPIFDYYAPVVITNNKLLNSNPQLVKKTLAAMKKGYIYAAKNPEESANILIKYAPETNKELALASQKYISKQYLDDEGDWGKFDYDRWDRFYDWVYKQGLIDKPLPPQAGVSNDYL